MKRPCFVGNSHIGCIRRALGRKEAPFRASATFGFGPRFELADCEVEDGWLTGSRMRVFAVPGGAKPDGKIRLGDHDFFALVGLGLGVTSMAHVYRTHRLREHWQEGRALMSPDCLTAVTRQTVEQSLAFTIATRLRRATDRPIYILPEPGLSERVLERGVGRGDVEGKGVEGKGVKAKEKAAEWAAVLADDRLGRFLHSCFVEAVQKAAATGGFEIVEQPETRRHGLTKAAFAHDTNADDVQHAGIAYGLKLLEELARRQ